MLENFLALFTGLSGHCYSADIAPGVRDRHCFAPMYDGAHIRDVHVVSQGGKTVYQGETIYSRVPDGLSFTYVNSEGGWGAGTAKVDGNVMTYAMTMRENAESAAKPFAGTWRLIDEGYVAQGDGEAPRFFTLSK